MALLQSRDTVSQPVASTQRPGRIYHADDFAPGLQRRREPPLVASAAVASRRAESNGAPALAGNPGMQPNGFADHGAATVNSRPSGETLGSEVPMLEPGSLELAAQPQDEDAQPRRQARKPQKAKGPPKPKSPSTARQARDTDAEPSAPSADVPAQQPNAEPPTTDAAAAAEPQKAAPLVLDGVQRDVEALAQCMACDICREVLLDPVHSSTCMHCYCRNCIDAFLVLGGTSNCCPVCQRADVATSLGRDPYKDNLKLDFVLANLIRKVFPGLAEDAACMAARQLKRSALNAALASQRASAAVTTTDRFPKRLRTDGRDVVELFVSGPEDMALEQPYLRVHRTMPAGTLARFLSDRLQDAGYGAEKVLLTCDGGALDPEEQLVSVLEQRWRAVPASGQLLTIEYSVEPSGGAK